MDPTSRHLPAGPHRRGSRRRRLSEITRRGPRGQRGHLGAANAGEPRTAAAASVSARVRYGATAERRADARRPLGGLEARAGDVHPYRIRPASSRARARHTLREPRPQYLSRDCRVHARAVSPVFASRPHLAGGASTFPCLYESITRYSVDAYTTLDIARYRCSLERLYGPLSQSLCSWGRKSTP